MKITIDTKEDSKEDIRLAISLLRSIADEPAEHIQVKKTEKKAEERKPENYKREGTEEKDTDMFTITPY